MPLTPEQEKAIDHLANEWAEGGKRQSLKMHDALWQQGYAAACRQIKGALNEVA